MNRQRVSALALLERLKRHDIESDARELGRLRAEASRLDRARDTLTRRLHDEAHVDDPALASYVGGFIRSMRSEIARVQRDRDRIEPDLATIETRVSNAFRELKTYETVRLTTLARAAAESARKEELAMEEAALMRWWRDKDAD